MIKSPEHGFFICHTDDYYNDFDEYFQNHVVNDGDLQGDEFVYPAKPVEIKLDAAEIINDWEESLRDHHDDTRHLWDLSSVKRWGAYQASDKQKALVAQFGLSTEGLTKLDAMQILTRVMCRAGA